MTAETTDLETFLEELPSEDAARARAAAGRIDELGRVTARTQGVESKYLPWFVVSGLLLVSASLMVFGSDAVFGEARRLIGVMGLTAMAAALPVLGIVYTFHVRDRTRADREMLELNRTHFLPYGGFYFPPGDDRLGRVVRTEVMDEEAQAKRRVERVRPGRSW